MRIEVSNKLFLTDFNKDILPEIRNRLTFRNPKWIENERMGRWNGNTSELLKFYELIPGGLLIPRGFMRQLFSICRYNNELYKIEDSRRTLPEVKFSFNARLKDFQIEAVLSLLENDQGVLNAPTGSGKTVMALYLVSERRQPALVIVHTKELLNQWIDRIETFLGIPKNEIGIIGAGKMTIGPRVTVATVQTLYKCAEQVFSSFGHLIVDECHRTPARTFTEAVTAFDCKYILGLSATPWRRDKLARLIFFHVGDVLHKIEKSDLETTGDIVPAEVVIRKTDFRPWSDPTMEYSKMLSELTADSNRNRLIASDIVSESKNGRGGVLVLSDRKSHCEAIRNILKDKFKVSSEVLTGDIPNKQREEIVERLNQGKIKILIATGQLIGEGFDCRELSTLFLTTPIRFSGRVIQYLGRVLRPAPGKYRAVVYDYVDINVGPLVSSAKVRQRVFQV